MQDQKHQSYNQDNVNEACGYVKRYEPQQPKNNQNRGEHR